MSMLILTPRGREVFELIMRGLTTAQIAERLGISYSGVLRHREKMLLQNDCRTMLELVATYHANDESPVAGKPGTTEMEAQYLEDGI